MHRVQIISTLLISAVCFIGGLFVLRSNYRRRPNRIIFLLTLATALFLPAQGVFEYIDPSHVVLWARIDTSTTIILDALTLLFACNFPRRLFGFKVEAIFGVVSIIIAAISFSPLMIAGGTSDGQTVQLATGALMPAYYAVDALYGILIVPAMIVQYKRGRKIDKLRIKYLLLGIGTIALMISIVGLWLPLIFHIEEAVNFIPLAILLGAGFLAYDVVALRLLSIRLVVARSVAYILLLIAIAGGYYFLAFWVGRHVFGTIQISQIGQLYQISIAFALAFLFQPVRRFFEKITDRIFYKNHYNTQKVVSDFTNILVSERDIEPLLQRSLAFICDSLHIGTGQVVVFDKGQPFAAESYKTKLLENETVVLLNKLDGNIVMSEYLADEDPVRTTMEGSGIWAMSKLVSQNEQVGILLLGDKLSGDIYSNQDTEALEIIGHELAVAVQNARAYRLLQEAQEQLKKTDQIKTEFITLASHNLRTPTGTVKMISEMLSSAKSPQEISNYTKMLSEVSTKLGDLVEELLIISSLESGRKHESFEIISVNSLLQPLADQAEQEAKNKGLKFGIALQTPDMRVNGNADHLRRVVGSILDNAVKFTKTGRVDINTAQDDGQCVINVADTGVGISNEELQKLFTKFHRGTDLEHYNYAGEGIDLYLAKLVVEEYGGQIYVASQLNKGTTVTVRLPLASVNTNETAQQLTNK